MKVLDATGRFIASPLGAVLFFAVGGFAIWYGVVQHSEGGRKASPRGEQGTGAPTVAGRGMGALARDIAAPAGSGAARQSPDAPGAIAARRRSDAKSRKTTAGREGDLEEIHVTAESEGSSMEADAAVRPGRRSATAADASTADVIEPGDPRAKALAEYQEKKAAVTKDVAAQKKLALWCDEHGLWDAAKSHWGAILRLEPENEAARRRLGFRWRDRHWVLDAASAEDVARKKADAYWKVLEIYHSQMRCRSKGAVPARSEAVAHLEAVGDPRAARAIWKVFAADSGHHGLIVSVLGRFKTSDASQMLAALAVYSRDDKARAAAVAALRGRGVAEYGEKLVVLMHPPMRVEERQVPVPGRAPARELLVEGDTANYRFLFSQVEAPSPESLAGFFQPRLSAGEIQFARQFNENQSAMARDGLDRQVEMAKQMIEKYNDAIRALNARVRAS